MLITSTSAIADDYGCKVLLCLANPAGPTTVSQCIPPITQLWKDLAKGHAFPSCDEAKPGYAQRTTNYYDLCPEGTTALAPGAYAVVAGSADKPVVGIGDGGDLSPDPDRGPLPLKTCVGKETGHIVIWVPEGDSMAALDAGVYERVVVLDPMTSSRAIDIYLDGLLYRRVRW